MLYYFTYNSETCLNLLDTFSIFDLKMKIPSPLLLDHQRSLKAVLQSQLLQMADLLLEDAREQTLANLKNTLKITE